MSIGLLIANKKDLFLKIPTTAIGRGGPSFAAIDTTPLFEQDRNHTVHSEHAKDGVFDHVKVGRIVLAQQMRAQKDQADDEERKVLKQEAHENVPKLSRERGVEEEDGRALDQ